MKRKYLPTLPMQRIIIMLISVVVCSCHRHTMGVQENAYSQSYKKMDTRTESNESLTSMHTEQLKNEVTTARQLLEELGGLMICTSFPEKSIKKGNIGRKLAIGSVALGGAVSLIYLMSHWRGYDSLPSAIDFNLYTRKVQTGLDQLGDFCAFDDTVDAVKSHIQWYVARLKDSLYRIVFEESYNVTDFKTHAENLVDKIIEHKEAENLVDKIIENREYDMVDIDATITWFKDLALNLMETFRKIAVWEKNERVALTETWHFDRNRRVQTYNDALYKVYNSTNILIDQSNKINNLNNLNSNLLWNKLLNLSCLLGICYLPPLVDFGWKKWKQSSTKQNEMLHNEVWSLRRQLLTNYNDLERKSKQSFLEGDQKRIDGLRNDLLRFFTKLIQVIKVKSKNIDVPCYESLNKSLKDLHTKMQEIDLRQTSPEHQEIFNLCIRRIDAMCKQMDPEVIPSVTWKTQTEEVKIHPV